MAPASIPDRPDSPDFVRFKPGTGRRFILTVDTEEEFDWSQPVARAAHTVHATARLARFQEFCEAQGVCPVYLIDYPIATAPAACEILRDAAARGCAEIGVQLHPWVNPPFDEEVSEANSFAGNLAPRLERDKFRRLREAIAEGCGVNPLIYRAGRYGAGPQTAAMLAEHGIAFDSSVRARFDYSAEAGPNYRDHPVRPYWLDRATRLIELPLTTVYWGPLRRWGPWLYPLLWRVPRLRGVLAKATLLERIPLTPEGVTLPEAIRGIDAAIAEDLPLLVFSFHSPSLAPGNTPYVQSEDDLDRLYAWWRGVFAHLAKRGVAATRVGELMSAVELA